MGRRRAFQTTPLVAGVPAVTALHVAIGLPFLTGVPLAVGVPFLTGVPFAIGVPFLTGVTGVTGVIHVSGMPDKHSSTQVARNTTMYNVFGDLQISLYFPTLFVNAGLQNVGLPWGASICIHIIYIYI